MAGSFIVGGNRSTQRKLEYPEETGVPRGNWSTQRKLEYPEETGVPRENPDLPQVTDKLYHIKLY
jgi:hypothetical protein